MKKRITFFFFLLMSAFLSGQIKTVPVTEFGEIIRQPGIRIVDVRSFSEYEQGHIPGAINLPIDTSSFNTAVSEWDKSIPIAFYCRSGIRSSRAIEIFKKNGFKVLYDLSGGILKWEEEGKPIEK